jgi:hypothetical protein
VAVTCWVSHMLQFKSNKLNTCLLLLLLELMNASPCHATVWLAATVA